MNNIKDILPLSSDTTDFNKTFVNMKHDFSLELSNQSSVEIFHLRKSNKAFTYDALKNMCLGNICQYVFNRMENESNITPYQRQILTKKAIDKFRQIRAEKIKSEDGKSHDDLGEGGELGELLLYLFLENRLKAPKLLSKMEIKTTRNQYVYGADGVHLHQTTTKSGKPVFQFVLGEAKIKNDILDAIRKAFTSIKQTVNEIDIEQGLVSLGIFKEVCDEQKANTIKEMILPTEDITETCAIHEKAFGIFIGYSVEFEDKTISNEEWNENVDKKIIDDISRGISTIKKQIENNKLDGYSIYIYFLPFNKADKDRKQIMDDIL